MMWYLKTHALDPAEDVILATARFLPACLTHSSFRRMSSVLVSSVGDDVVALMATSSSSLVRQIFGTSAAAAAPDAAHRVSDLSARVWDDSCHDSRRQP